MEKIWAFEKNSLLTYLSHRENATIDTHDLTAESLGERLGLTGPIMRVEGETARIAITGPLSKAGPDVFDLIFGYGGTAYSSILEALREAESRDDVKNIVLEMDTPGGEVSGVDEVNRAIAGCDKPVTAENHGMIASAGMWIASAADKIVAMEPTAFTGSIGVLITSVDVSEAESQRGMKVVRIVSRNAPKKVVDASTDAGRKVLQDHADAIERQFIARVAEGRGVTKEYVAENFGQGDIMIARDLDSKKPDALSVGMIDAVAPGMDAPYDKRGKKITAVAMAETPADAGKNTDPDLEAQAEGEGEETQEVRTMTLKELMAENPAAKAELNEMLADAKNAGVTEGRKEIEDRIAKASPYVASDYPVAIQKLAAKVMSGEEHPAALSGAVAMYDATKEAGASADAQADTQATGETPADASQGPSGSIIPMKEEDFQAQLAAFKKANGTGGK